MSVSLALNPGTPNTTFTPAQVQPDNTWSSTCTTDFQGQTQLTAQLMVAGLGQSGPLDLIDLFVEFPEGFDGVVAADRAGSAADEQPA